jgi:GT2 family glycosyltransferase
VLALDRDCEPFTLKAFNSSLRVTYVTEMKISKSIKKQTMSEGFYRIGYLHSMAQFWVLWKYNLSSKRIVGKIPKDWYTFFLMLLLNDFL